MKTSLCRRMAAFVRTDPRRLAHDRREHLRAGRICIELSPFAATVPSGFTDALVAAGMTWPTAIAVADDGRVFVNEQSGTLRVIKNGTLSPRRSSN